MTMCWNDSKSPVRGRNPSALPDGRFTLQGNGNPSLTGKRGLPGMSGFGLEPSHVRTKALASGRPLPEVSTPRAVSTPEKMSGSLEETLPGSGVPVRGSKP